VNQGPYVDLSWVWRAEDPEHHTWTLLLSPPTINPVSQRAERRLLMTTRPLFSHAVIHRYRALTQFQFRTVTASDFTEKPTYHYRYPRGYTHQYTLDSSESEVSSSSGSSSSSRRSRLSQPTNMLMITPLPTHSFGSSVLDSLRRHFPSFSGLACTPVYSNGQTGLNPYPRYPPNLSTVPPWLYNPDDAECPHQAGDRHYALCANDPHT
jgi:hypothetical protein